MKFGKKDGDSMLLAADSAEKAAEWKSFLDEMVNKAANRSAAANFLDSKVGQCHIYRAVITAVSA